MPVDALLRPDEIDEVHKTVLFGLSRTKAAKCQKPPWSPREADDGGVNVYCELQIFG